MNIQPSRVLIAMGSNTLPSVHIQWASERLTTLLSDISFSRKLWTEDYHGTGVWYMNRLVCGTTVLSADELTKALKDIEVETQRTKGHVTLDLDLMLYNEQRYHERDWERSYILNAIHSFNSPFFRTFAPSNNT